MLQAIMKKPGVIDYIEINKPRPKDNEILIKVKRMGICGSDIHVFKGTHPYTNYPIVQGHEISGIIEEVGNSIEDYNPGDRIIIIPQLTCGKCYPCKHGMYHICDNLKVLGFQINGAAQEYIALDSKMVLKIPDSLDLDEGAIIEPAAVALHAVKKGGEIGNKKILVLGGGTVGNLVAQSAKSLGGSKVMITDISDFKLEIAKKYNIDFTVNSNKEDIDKTILNNFSKDKADIIFECVGIQNTISQAISVARKGSKIIVVGVYGEKPIVDMGLVQDHELIVIGSLMYQKNDFLEIIELVSEGKIDLKKLITTRFSFLNFNDAYKYILENKNKVMKVIINFSN